MASGRAPPSMSLAAAAREAVQERPFLLEALRAGVVNYAAAARLLDLGDDETAVATALRRYAERLPPRTVEACRATVTIHSGLSREEGGEGLLAVNGTVFAGRGGDLTAVLATGAVDAPALGHVLARVGAGGIAPVAAGAGGDALLVVVERRDGPATLEVVEAALETVPDPTV